MRVLSLTAVLTLARLVSAKNDMNARATVAPTSSPSAVPTSVPTKVPKGNDRNNGGEAGEPTDLGLPGPFVYPPEFVGGTFCKAPTDPDQGVAPKICETETNRWKELTQSHSDMTFYQRPFTEECGPNCRPSCLTLMLDLDDLSYGNDLTCKEDEFCFCEHEKGCTECTEEEEWLMQEVYPKCYLEKADCLGPTVYDDVVAFTKLLAGANHPDMCHCTCIPDNDDTYCRFQDWPMVRPMGDPSCSHECFDPPRKVFWEFCNIVEEDPDCDTDNTNDECRDGKCGKKCKKIVEPFPDGWTTFVVTAPIDFVSGENSECDKKLEYADQTDSACFLQRIELYYPPKDEDCSEGCPTCHDCPLLSLGDKFGPLEVVGFGHCLNDGKSKHNQECAACDRQDEKMCSGECNIDCDLMDDCADSVDCYSGSPLGIADFVDECTFCIDDVLEEGFE